MNEWEWQPWKTRTAANVCDRGVEVRVGRPRAAETAAGGDIMDLALEEGSRPSSPSSRTTKASSPRLRRGGRRPGQGSSA